jgi:hypothetical protein
MIFGFYLQLVNYKANFWFSAQTSNFFIRSYRFLFYVCYQKIARRVGVLSSLE